jgi:hypothetical protein
MSVRPEGPTTSGRRASPGTAPRFVPRQRDRRRGDVVAVVVSGDHCANTVLAAAKIASDGEQPLVLVTFTDPERSPRSTMVTVDRALTVARTVFPLLEVRVELGLADTPGWDRSISGRVARVVVDPAVAARWRDRDDHLLVTVVE